MSIGKYFQLQWFRVLYWKLMRRSGSPEYNARGVALGLFVGLLVPMGFQLLVVIPLAFLFRTSKVLAGAMTFVTNHVTVLFIYPVQCYIGSYLLFRPLSYAEVSEKVRALIVCGSMREACRELAELGLELGAAFFAGGLLFAVVAGSIGYVVTLKLMTGFRRRRELRRRKREKKAGNEANDSSGELQ